MSYLSIEVQCEECQDVSGIIVEREQRNDPQICLSCGGEATRIWSVPNVSTVKLSEAIPDVVAKGRFDRAKEVHKARKEIAKAKSEYVKNPTSKNAEEIKRARTEKKKIERNI